MGLPLLRVKLVKNCPFKGAVSVVSSDPSCMQRWLGLILKDILKTFIKPIIWLVKSVDF